MLFRVFRRIALGAGELVKTVVWLWIHYIMLNLHDLSTGGPHECCRMVAVSEVAAFLAGYLFYIFFSVYALRIHCHKRGETVSAMYVESLRHWSKPVGGVDVATVVAVIYHAPSELRLVVRVFPIFIPVRVEGVYVSSFCA